VTAPAARSRAAWPRLAALEPLAWHLFAAALVVAMAAAFLAPARERVGPSLWPAPLDDVYIHFAFARSAALGHPFEWLPGNGYSSGGTSLVYPLVLALGWLVGFRGTWLGVFASVVAVASVVDLARSLRRLLGGAPRFAAWLVPPLLLAVPLLDWSLFSGMETALFAAFLGRALVASSRALDAPAHARASAQLVAGAWLAALVAARPEAAALSLPLAVAVVHGARALATLGSLARAAGPTIGLVLAQAAVNRALTGEAGAAGAVRKLVFSNPYATPLELAIEVLRNLAVLRAQAFDVALGGGLVALAAPALALVAIAERRTRRLGVSLAIGAALCLALVCTNATARFQNLRYAAPSLVMLLAAAALGAGALARRGRLGAAAAIALSLAAVAGPAAQLGPQVRHFARASGNIADQQVRVAAIVRDRRPARVLVNDAGAIPYLSGVPAIDGLGLGGFRGLPFARASVHGVPAVVELLERLPPADRPDLLAVYPGWWGGLADVFGRRVAAVRIEDNVICGADEKVVYEADWGALSGPEPPAAGLLDELDVADLVSERDHAYALPRRGGWVVGRALAIGHVPSRFDAGRIVPEGEREAFALSPSVPRGPATLRLRTDAGPRGALRVTVTPAAGPARVLDVDVPDRPEGAWYELDLPLGDVAPRDTISIEARASAWRDFHAWLLAAPGGPSGR
jgi:hypothetical protein